MQPINDLEEAYTADVIRRTERAFAPGDEVQKILKERLEADVAAGIRMVDSESYTELQRYRARPKRRVSVPVSFLIERSGQVQNIELIEDSGYDFVNSAAMSAAQYGAPFRPVPIEFECPFKVFVKLHAYVDDPTIAAADEIPKKSKRIVDGRRLHDVVERYGGWEKVMSSDFEVTDELLTAIEVESGMDSAMFLGMKATELLEPRTKALRAAATFLYCGWFDYQRQISPRRGGPQKGREEWERILANFWHLHGAKLDELGILIDEVVTEIEKDSTRYPTVNTEMFFELTQIRRPDRNSVRLENEA